MNPFPAIDPNGLGEDKAVLIDRLLIPYIIGALEQLTYPDIYSGDFEDVTETVLAVKDHIKRLANAKEPTEEAFVQGASVTRSTDVFQPQGVLAWNVEQYDTDEIFSLANQNILTIRTPGTYLLVLNLLVDAASSAFTLNASITRNNTATIAAYSENKLSHRVNLARIIELEENDILRVVCDTLLAANATLQAADYYSPIFTVQRVR